MKTTRNLFVLIFISMILTSCFFGTANDDANYDDFGYEDEGQFDTAYSEGIQGQQAYNNQRQNEPINRPARNGLVMKPIKDAKTGMVMMHAPMPQSWKLNPNSEAPIQITGPNNVQVNKTETQNFGYAQDALGQQTIQKLGMQLAPLQPLSQILQQHIAPSAKSQGYTLTRSYAMPGYEQVVRKAMSGMYNSGRQRNVSVMGTEWQGTNGKKSFILLVQSSQKDNSFTAWQLQTTELEAPASEFENAKKTYIYSIENIQINPQWQQAKNQELIANKEQNDAQNRQTMQQSQAAHQQRMANIAAAGNNARNIGKTYSEISDISHNGYMSRSATTSVGQSNAVNGVWERQNMTDNSGNQYQVQGYDSNVWVNPNNQTIGTNTPNYNPNLDNGVNNQNWEQLQSTDDWNY